MWALSYCVPMNFVGKVQIGKDTVLFGQELMPEPPCSTCRKELITSSPMGNDCSPETQRASNQDM